MNKTLIFNGSPRKNGDTSSLLEILCENLSGEIKVVDCYTADISPCVDCRRCKESPFCPVNDEMQEIYEYVKTCDNLVIASPVYFSQPTGKLLDTMSRFQLFFSARYFRNQPFEIKNKKGGIILTGGGSGSVEKACETAKLVLKGLNTTEVYPLVSSCNTDRIPAISDEKAISQVRNLAEYLNG